MGRERVILRQAPDYDPERIRSVIKKGLEELCLVPSSYQHITIKPNVVMAHRKVAPSAYTRPEFLDGLLQALQDSDCNRPQITITEKCGAEIPTTRMFRRAGYFKLKKKHNIGILLDRERIWNHNYHLDEKIVDLLEVGYPDFIATDAVEISMGGNHLTQQGYPLGLILMAKNPVAHDAVCAHLFHIDPHKIPHLRLAHERGYGPLELEQIEITGDTSLEKMQERTSDWKTGFIRVDAVDCGIEVLAGEPYCTGGCHGG
ncbi:MAG: DUF362 domain-containing protein [Candidatus Aminicenantes bacterium]|nr:DUF362 domain-containing protein [Candidatus Aminicenantes bacterium]MDH5383130.1 DUF362 domain-containing protein [Candidatus Aminicenantes bacterium]MDH5742455.1 DUF362 domain-containing protein [Candidatus Aminicenantes bacterium]